MEPYMEAKHRKLIPTPKLNTSKNISIHCTIETKITLISTSNSDKGTYQDSITHKRNNAETRIKFPHPHFSNSIHQ